VPNIIYQTPEEAKRTNMLVYTDLMEALQTLKYNKPNNRSDADRYWAIVITDMEKVIAFYNRYILDKE
jgi:hypothetical protein